MSWFTVYPHLERVRLAQYRNNHAYFFTRRFNKVFKSFRTLGMNGNHHSRIDLADEFLQLWTGRMAGNMRAFYPFFQLEATGISTALRKRRLTQTISNPKGI
jgi:hypothetical protein